MILEKYAYKIVQIAIINVHNNKTYTSKYIFLQNATDAWKMQCHKNLSAYLAMILLFNTSIYTQQIYI